MLSEEKMSKVSNRYCDFTKKNPLKKYEKENSNIMCSRFGKSKT
ncbi:MAG: hypothetical protein R3Y29_08405 [bacterium]